MAKDLCEAAANTPDNMVGVTRTLTYIHLFFYFFIFYFFTKKHSPTNNQGKRTTEMTLDNKTKGSRGDVPMWLARLIRPEVSES